MIGCYIFQVTPTIGADSCEIMATPPDLLPDDARALKESAHRRARRERASDRHHQGASAPSLRPAIGEDRSGPTSRSCWRTLSKRSPPARRRPRRKSKREPAGTPVRRKRQINRGALPKHLPREEVVVDLADKCCPCCNRLRVKLGEDVSERLDMILARFKVIVTRRPKYACRDSDGEVAQAPVPEHLIEGGIPTEALIARRWSSPNTRTICRSIGRLEIYGRQGVELDRSTLADWSGRAAFALRPVYERLFDVLKGSDKLFADETRAPVLDPGRPARPRQASCGPMPATTGPGAVPEPPERRLCLRARPQARASRRASGRLRWMPPGRWLRRLQEALAEGNAVTLAFCWAHARRNFFDIQAANSGPDRRRGAGEDRRPLRHRTRYPGARSFGAAGRPPSPRQSDPRGDEALVGGQARRCLRQIETRREAIRYTLSRWAGLTRYLDDGRIEIDNNVVERAMRPIALGRKNHLFAGSDEGGRYWAIHASLIETCKMNHVDPQAWLADVLDKIANRHPA